MRKTYPDNEAFFADLRNLIDGWCERRCLQPLSIVLPAYSSFNGMTDGWGELLKALQALAVLPDGLLPDEHDTVTDLQRAAEGAIGVR